MRYFYNGSNRQILSQCSSLCHNKSKNVRHYVEIVDECIDQSMNFSASRYALVQYDILKSIAEILTDTKLMCCFSLNCHFSRFLQPIENWVLRIYVFPLIISSNWGDLKCQFIRINIGERRLKRLIGFFVPWYYQEWEKRFDYESIISNKRNCNPFNWFHLVGNSSSFSAHSDDGLVERNACCFCVVSYKLVCKQFSLYT